MSYILNALRKSERERQAMQPDTVTNRITVEQTSERQSLTKIVLVLVGLNVAILAYFLSIAPQPTEDKQQPVTGAEKPMPMLARGNPPLPADGPPKPARIYPVPKLEQARNPTPIPEKPAKSPKPPVEPIESVQRVKPPVALPQPVKPLAAVITEPQPASKPVAEPVSSLPPKPVAEPSELAAKKPEPVRAAPAQSNIPTVADLPPEIRQSLPSLPINVFSYSSSPAERFVMIDMIKYVPGQTIKNELELKEIVEDGIIVRYEGRVFKINR
jgi:general secretion pathway protein B